MARVTILLSTFNGAAYLDAQLASLVAQTEREWRLLWRDDGSWDATVRVMAGWQSDVGAGCCQELPVGGHLGVAESYFALLRAGIAAGATAVAFADQDDVWLPFKLERALAALTTVRAGRPALYCARQVLVAADLRRIGLSAPVRALAFPAALTQNVATGCTVLMNEAAARLVAMSTPPPTALHDWWSYLVVAVAGGQIIADPEPVVLYRQHGGNRVGAPRSVMRRAVGAVRRGPDLFMDVLRRNVAALCKQPHLVAPEHWATLERIERGLDGGVMARLSALMLPGLRRQTWEETLLFRLWFMLG